MYSILISAFTAIILLLALYVSWRYNRRSLYLQTFENVIERWQSAETVKYRKVVAEEVKQLKKQEIIFPINHPPPRYTQLFNAMRNVSHFFDSLGVRAHQRYVDKKLIYASLAGTIMNHWDILGPYILEERKWLKQHEERSYHQFYFEWLSKDAKKNFNPKRHLPGI